jgi:hypothetical protein
LLEPPPGKISELRPHRQLAIALEGAELFAAVVTNQTIDLQEVIDLLGEGKQLLPASDAKMVVWHGKKTNRAEMTMQTPNSIKNDNHFGSGSQSNIKIARGYGNHYLN